MNNIISIDFGFGNIKAVTETAKVIFKSAFSQNDDNGFTVGEKAIKNTKVIYPQTIDDLIALYPHVFQEACIRFSLTEKEVTPVIGLPLQAYKSEAIKMKLRNTFLERDIHITIYPQTASVAWLTPQGENSLIIDIGFNTVIACLVSPEKEILYSRTYYHHGAISIAEKFNDAISDIFSSTGKTLSLPELDAIVQKKVFQLGLDVYDYTDKIKEIKENYIRETIFKVIKDVKVNLSSSITFSNVFLVGGLANEIKLSSEKVNIIIPTDSIYANAKAFYIRKMSSDWS